MNNIERSELKVKAANMRILSASQTANAAAHRRQALHPAYAGQSGICTGKAAMIDGFAARSLASAELLEAQAVEA